MMKETATICLVFLVLAADRGLSFDEEKAKTFLLPGNLKPTHYNVHLVTKLDKFEIGNDSSFTFDGGVQIFMNVVENNVRDVVLNLGKFTAVRRTTFYRSGQKPVSLGKGSYNKTTEKVTFPLPDRVRKGESLRFDIYFTAQHTDPGFIYDFYYGKNDTKRWFVYTDLQPASARLVFPCFDEPKYKATYKVTVSIPRALISAGYHALSNAPEFRREEVGENTLIHFEQTRIPMSMYLFAVIVSDYVSTKPRYFNSSNPNPKHNQLKTWGKPDDMKTYGGEGPQAMALALVKIFTKEFGIAYNFGKIDQVGVHGYPMAMENWGLIIYEGTFISEFADYSAMLIAHELSHQWFGNLVTLHWWSDVWLNEGFASYFEYFGPDKINEDGLNGKDLKLPYHFIIDKVQFQGMSSDVPEANNNPLTVEVYDPNEYSEYFNRYSYGKGPSIIFMWRNIFGEKAFRKVLRHYLKSFQGGVATPEGLLGCFDRYANESESDLDGMKPSIIFRNWHVKAGVPIVSVRKMKESPSIYVLSQDVFRWSKLTQVEQAEWTIPISYSTSDNDNFNSTKAEIWLTPGKNQVLKLAKPVKWIVVNNQESGYYRVNYNLENWKELFRVLNESEHEIHEINRAQLIDDAMEIAKSTAFDFLPYEMVLDMMLYLQKEPSYFPWKSALNKLEFLKNHLAKNETIYPLFRMFVLDLVKNRIESSWSAQRTCDGSISSRVEKTVINWACEMGHPSCLRETKLLPHSQQERGRKVCADSFEVIYCAYTRNNSDNITWDEVWNDYTTTEDAKLKRSLLRGLGCTKNRLLLTRLLEKSIDSESKFSRDERAEIFSAVLSGNAENVKAVINFLEDNINNLNVALSHRYLNWNTFIGIAERLSTDEEISRMRKLTIDLIRINDMQGIGDKLSQVTASIMSANREWRNVRSKSVSDWLIARYSTRRKAVH